jgi:hypothetical protein
MIGPMPASDEERERGVEVMQVVSLLVTATLYGDVARRNVAAAEMIYADAVQTRLVIAAMARLIIDGWERLAETTGQTVEEVAQQFGLGVAKRRDNG